ncbi:MAG: 50S ribosomal protein L22 [Christensenellales bacterium]
MATNTREKGEKRAQTRDKRPQAHVKNVRVSSRKAGQVVDLIRGKNVDTALAILQFTPKATSPIVIKLLNSAIANAVNNLDLDRSTLYVAEVYANPGPTLKRFVARSRGSASPILKRTSHISVVLDQR